MELLAQWLQARGVQEVVMESTAQYGKPVWQALEPDFRLHLARSPVRSRATRPHLRALARLDYRVHFGEPI